jgi:hypothetical protein
MVTVVALILVVVAIASPIIHERYFDPKSIAARHERQERRAQAFDQVWDENWKGSDEDNPDGFNNALK